MQTNVIINSTATPGNKKITTTITYVNPQAVNNKLLSLAQSLNALTTNTFVNATKETKGDVL